MKKVLLISDNPGTRTFQSILNLKILIQKEGGIITEVFFSKFDNSHRDRINSEMNDNSIVVISLVKNNLKLLTESLLSGKMMMKETNNYFIFGAPSLSNNYVPYDNVFFFNRYGVSKTSQSFKQSILKSLAS